jgi:hypothetical protein
VLILVFYFVFIYKLKFIYRKIIKWKHT